MRCFHDFSPVLKQVENAKMGTQNEKMKAWYEVASEQDFVKEWDEPTKQHNLACARIKSRRNKMTPFDDDQSMRKMKMKKRLQAKLEERNPGGCPEAQPM